MSKKPNRKKATVKLQCCNLCERPIIKVSLEIYILN